MAYDHDAVQAKLLKDPYYFRRQRYEMNITDRDYSHQRVLAGSIGGKAKHPNKGFGSDKERARTAGIKGGLKSRRGK